jgi:hypothetical protein
MPHFRANIRNVSMEEVDSKLREARVGVVTASEVENPANASGTPGEKAELESVKVSVDASDTDDAQRKLEEVLPEGASIEILG